MLLIAQNSPVDSQSLQSMLDFPNAFLVPWLAGVLAVLGLLLWAVGIRLHKPLVIIACTCGGIAVGVAVSSNMSIHPAWLPVIMGLVGMAVGCLAFRLYLGLALAVVMSVIGLGFYISHSVVPQWHRAYEQADQQLLSETGGITLPGDVDNPGQTDPVYHCEQAKEALADIVRPILGTKNGAKTVNTVTPPQPSPYGQPMQQKNTQIGPATQNSSTTAPAVADDAMQTIEQLVRPYQTILEDAVATTEGTPHPVKRLWNALAAIAPGFSLNVILILLAAVILAAIIIVAAPKFADVVTTTLLGTIMTALAVLLIILFQWTATFAGLIMPNPGIILLILLVWAVLGVVIQTAVAEPEPQYAGKRKDSDDKDSDSKGDSSSSSKSKKKKKKKKIWWFDTD